MATLIDRAEFRELGILVAVEEYFDDGTGLRTTYVDGGPVGEPMPCPGIEVPAVVPFAAEIEAARTLLLSSSTNTVLLTKQRAAALDALRGQQLAALLSPPT